MVGRLVLYLRKGSCSIRFDPKISAVRVRLSVTSKQEQYVLRSTVFSYCICPLLEAAGSPSLAALYAISVGCALPELRQHFFVCPQVTVASHNLPCCAAVTLASPLSKSSDISDQHRLSRRLVWRHTAFLQMPQSRYVR